MLLPALLPRLAMVAISFCCAVSCLPSPIHQDLGDTTNTPNTRGLPIHRPKRETDGTFERKIVVKNDKKAMTTMVEDSYVLGGLHGPVTIQNAGSTPAVATTEPRKARKKSLASSEEQLGKVDTSKEKKTSRKSWNPPEDAVIAIAIDGSGQLSLRNLLGRAIKGEKESNGGEVGTAEPIPDDYDAQDDDSSAQRDTVFVNNGKASGKSVRFDSFTMDSTAFGCALAAEDDQEAASEDDEAEVELSVDYEANSPGKGGRDLSEEYPDSEEVDSSNGSHSNNNDSSDQEQSNGGSIPASLLRLLLERIRDLPENNVEKEQTISNNLCQSRKLSKTSSSRNSRKINSQRSNQQVGIALGKAKAGRKLQQPASNEETDILVELTPSRIQRAREMLEGLRSKASRKPAAQRPRQGRLLGTTRTTTHREQAEEETGQGQVFRTKSQPGRKRARALKNGRSAFKNTSMLGKRGRNLASQPEDNPDEEDLFVLTPVDGDDTGAFELKRLRGP